VNHFFPSIDNYPQIAKVEKETALGSILVAVENPPRGGDTLSASTCLA